MASLWGGRFEKEMDDIVKEFNASIGFDKRMYNEDIDGSIAHVTMLGEQGIVTEEEAGQIIAGLETIRGKIASGEILFDVDDEDIHMGIESRLIAEIGDVAKKLHTARSRNDQCQVDGRLYLKKEIREIVDRLCYLEEVILEKAEKVRRQHYRRLYPYPACSAHHHRLYLHGLLPDVQKRYRKADGYL